MFVNFWLIFLSSGLVMAVITVVWGIRTRQFEEQKRARFIPLRGLTAEEINKVPRKKHFADYVGVCAMLIVGLAAIGAGLLLAFMRHS